MPLAKSVTEDSNDARYSDADFMGEDDINIPSWSDDDHESDYECSDEDIEPAPEKNFRVSVVRGLLAGPGGGDPTKRESLRARKILLKDQGIVGARSEGAIKFKPPK
eukprot:UN14558